MTCCFNQNCTNKTRGLFCDHCCLRTNSFSNKQVWQYAYRKSIYTLELLLNNETISRSFLNKLLLTEGFRDYLVLHDKFFINMYSAYLILTGELPIKKTTLSRLLYKRFLINQINIHPDLNFNLPSSPTYKDLFESKVY